MGIKIYTYNTNKDVVPSAFRLREALEDILQEKVWIVASGTDKVKKGDILINWGYSRTPYWNKDVARWINLPMNISNATSKLRSFQLFHQHGVPHPDWTTDKKLAKSWLACGHTVLARETDHGFDGEGITVVRPGSALPPALFYTKLLPASREFRVSVVDGQIVDFTEKKPDVEVVQDENQKLIRTSSGGWLLCRDGVNLPMACRTPAVDAVRALGLDFGGVDIILSNGKPYILEVNTAPEIFSLGAARYAAAIHRQIRGS